MADNTIDTKNTAIAATQQTQQSQTKTTSSLTGKTNDVMDQQQFLQLLVNQLQNQDPLDPMNSEEFAVQLAQFSQLEQLIGINNKLGEGGVGGGEFGGVGSMASFLGNEVVLSKDNAVTINGGSGQNVLLNLPAGTRGGRIDLLDESGNVAGSVNLENPSAGNNVVALKNVDVPDGDYQVRALIVDGEGKFKDVSPRITGTVEGFVLEPSPALIVNGEEVALEDVTEVFAGKKA